MSRWRIGFLVVCWAVPASAHQKSVSYSKWNLVDGGAVAEAKVSWFDLTSLPEMQDARASGLDSSAFIPYLERSLSLHTAAGPCIPVDGSAQLLPAERGWLRAEWRVQCDGAPQSLRSDLFTSLVNHVHLASFFGPARTDVVLSSTSPVATIAIDTDSPEGGLRSYVRLGIEHIVSGWDHITFLFLLIVIAARLREVVWLVTGFTVGHSITLAAAAFGAIVPNPRAVEAIIAVSILVVALENTDMEDSRAGRLVLAATLVLFVCGASVGHVPAFWGVALFTACYFALLQAFPRRGRLRWVVACLFGLVHGLGFSTVLLERELPRAELVEALFGFNVGVELGQLALVALIWPLLQWFRRRELSASVVEWTSVAGAAVATFALIVRVFGP